MLSHFLSLSLTYHKHHSSFKPVSERFTHLDPPIEILTYILEEKVKRTLYSSLLSCLSNRSQTGCHHLEGHLQLILLFIYSSLFFPTSDRPGKAAKVLVLGGFVTCVVDSQRMFCQKQSTLIRLFRLIQKIHRRLRGTMYPTMQMWKLL